MQEILRPLVDKNSTLEDEVTEINLGLSEAELEKEHLTQKLEEVKKHEEEQKAIEEEIQKLLKEKDVLEKKVKIIQQYESGTISDKELQRFSPITIKKQKINLKTLRVSIIRDSCIVQLIEWYGVVYNFKMILM